MLYLDSFPLFKTIFMTGDKSVILYTKQFFLYYNIFIFLTKFPFQTVVLHTHTHYMFYDCILLSLNY